MPFQQAIDALARTFDDILAFLPHVVNGIIILVVGLLLSSLIRSIVLFAARTARVDLLAERLGIARAMGGFGIQAGPSTILSQLVYLILALSFVTTAMREMRLDVVARMLEGLVLFFPSMIAAAIMLFAGSEAGRLVGNVVAAGAAGAGLAYPRRIGRLIQYTILLFVVVLALGVLGVETAILVTAVTIMIAAFGLALGISLGLGARSIVQHVLAGYYIRQRLPSGTSVVVGDVRGSVRDVGSVNTLLEAPDGAALVPNVLLLESMVRTVGRATTRRPDEPPPAPPD